MDMDKILQSGLATLEIEVAFTRSGIIETSSFPCCKQTEEKLSYGNPWLQQSSLTHISKQDYFAKKRKAEMQKY